VQIANGRIQVSGQVAVMAINGLLTKNIFDKNPDHDFYVEESFPLDWMYPYLTPSGIIMKINREPLPDLTEEILARDHYFWSKYSDRFIGDWITYDTPISNICAWAERTYHVPGGLDRRNFKNFTGDIRFARDDDAQKAFSKLRSAIGGVYAWRLNQDCPPAYRPKSDENRIRIAKEADFAFKQSFAFCPYSPEAVFRYTNLLLAMQRLDDALAIAQTFQRLDPYNPSAKGLVDQLTGYKQQSTQAQQTAGQIAGLEALHRSNPTNFDVALKLVQEYARIGQPARASEVLDRFMFNPQTDVNTFFMLADLYGQLQMPEKRQLALAQMVGIADRIAAHPQADANALINAARIYSSAADGTKAENLMKLLNIMTRLSVLQPGSPETWYDLAAIQATLANSTNALDSLKRAIQLSDQRLGAQPQAKNLREEANKDGRFTNLRVMADFQQLLPQK
jgi:tetratricopeptide (TPR) repeat protein